MAEGTLPINTVEEWDAMAPQMLGFGQTVAPAVGPVPVPRRAPGPVGPPPIEPALEL